MSDHAQPPAPIPNEATVIERRNVSKDRELVLWMLKATKHESEIASDDIYTCPDHTRGSYYSGRANVSLIDTSSSQTINTVEIKGFDGDGADSEIDLPYSIRAGFYYEVPNGSAKIEKKPRILAFKDHNGDGKAHEFALFNAQACMGLDTTLIGYSTNLDKVIQYPISVSDEEGRRTVYWLDYLFSKKATSAGRWRYEIDYRGRGGTLDKFDVRYDRQKQEFIATIHRER